MNCKARPACHFPSTNTLTDTKLDHFHFAELSERREGDLSDLNIF